MLAACRSHYLNVFSAAGPVGRGSPARRGRGEHKPQLAAPWTCKPAAFCSLGMGRRTGGRRWHRPAGCIRAGNVWSLVAKHQILKAEKAQRMGMFCVSSGKSLVRRDDPCQGHHIGHGHHLGKSSQVSRQLLVHDGKQQHHAWASKSGFSYLRAVLSHPGAEPCSQGRSGVLTQERSEGSSPVSRAGAVLSAP